MTQRSKYLVVPPHSQICKLNVGSAGLGWTQLGFAVGHRFNSGLPKCLFILRLIAMLECALMVDVRRMRGQVTKYLKLLLELYLLTFSAQSKSLAIPSITGAGKGTQFTTWRGIVESHSKVNICIVSIIKRED